MTCLHPKEVCGACQVISKVLSHLTHLVAYSRKMFLLIQPFLDALIMTPTGASSVKASNYPRTLMDHNWWHHLPHGISKYQYSCIFTLLLGHNLGCGYPSLTHYFPFLWNIWTSTFITIPDLPRRIYFQLLEQGFILVKNLFMTAGLAHIALFTDKLCAFLILISGWHFKKNCIHFSPAFLLLCEKPLMLLTSAY